MGKTTSSIFGLSAIAALAGILMGLDIGIIGGSGVFIYQSFHIPETADFIRGLTTASVPIGGLMGAVLSAKVTRSIGRKNSLMLSALIYAAGALIIGTAPNISLVILGRLAMGISVGLVSMTTPMYLGEIAPRESRGTIIFMFQLAITIGIFLAYLINEAFESTQNWRMMFLTCLVPTIIYIACIPRLPRSPRWLIQKNRVDEARAVLKRIRGIDNVEHEINDITQAVKHMAGSFTAIFNRQFFPLVLTAFLLFVFQQLSGINAVLYYVTTMFNKAGFTVSDAIYYSLFVGAINMIATVAGVLLVERLGRRPLLFIGMIGIVISLGALGANYKGLLGHTEFTNLLSVICVLAFVASFAISLGGIPYIIMAEIFPLNVRHLGMSVATFANWAFNSLVAFTFLYLMNSIGIGNTYWLYAFCTVAGIIFVKFFVPETRNVALETIEENLYAGRSLRALGNAA